MTQIYWPINHPFLQLAMTPLPTVAIVLAKLQACAITLPPGDVRISGYGDSPALSTSLIGLIRTGQKRAGTGLVWGFAADGEALPEVGQIEIVVDHLNEPALVTRLTSVQIVAFADVTAEYAAIEGEGDGSLAYWRHAHWDYFTRECVRIGREPAESMMVVCSVFEVIIDLAE